MYKINKSKLFQIEQLDMEYMCTCRYTYMYIVFSTTHVHLVLIFKPHVHYMCL